MLIVSLYDSPISILVNKMLFILTFRNLRQEHIQIRLNLVVAIAIAQIVFLTGIDASQTKMNYVNGQCFSVIFVRVVLFKTQINVFLNCLGMRIMF